MRGSEQLAPADAVLFPAREITNDDLAIAVHKLRNASVPTMADLSYDEHVPPRVAERRLSDQISDTDQISDQGLVTAPSKGLPKSSRERIWVCEFRSGSYLQRGSRQGGPLNTAMTFESRADVDEFIRTHDWVAFNGGMAVFR